MVWNISKDKNNNNTNTRITSMASFGVFIVNVEDISNLFSSVSIVDFEQINVSLERQS